jgi:hypothetical protein
MTQHKPGDVIGFSGRGWLSDAVNLCTYGIPRVSISHVGIVAKAKGELYVFESTSIGDIPCALLGKPIEGTQAHKLEDTVGRYDGSVWKYSLHRNLYPHESRRLSLYLLDTLGVEYDRLGAIRSAGVGLSWAESLFREENLTSIFCSEWVMSAISKTGIFPTDNVSRWSPNKMIRRLRRAGIIKRPERLK